jgi:hypothetical protein
METIVVLLDLLRRLLQRAGPYLLVEIILPGGTLIALLLFLYRRYARVTPLVDDCTAGR